MADAIPSRRITFTLADLVKYGSLLVALTLSFGWLQFQETQASKEREELSDTLDSVKQAFEAELGLLDARITLRRNESTEIMVGLTEIRTNQGHMTRAVDKLESKIDGR